MKKTVSVILSVLTFLSILSGCTKIKKTALVISGTDIDAEIYSYFLDKITSKPDEYGLPVNPEETEARDAAIEQCKRYLAINTYYSENNLSLTPADKTGVSEKVNNFWLRFSAHYDKIGVSRQTLNKIITSEAYEDAIFNALYDKGVLDSSSEKINKDYFYSNYVAFRTVCAYFTLEDGTAVSAAEKNVIIDNFNSIAKNSGSAYSGFDDACEQVGYTASNTIILERNSDGYPTGFFGCINNQISNSVSIYMYDECIFAVRKEDLKEMGEGVYAGYRSECIKAIYADDWEQTLSDYIGNFEVEEIKIR